MLSRTADHLFWMARYTERAENTARMLDVNLQTSLLPQSPEDAEKGWRAMLGISELQAAYDYKYPVLNAKDRLHGVSVAIIHRWPSLRILFARGAPSVPCLRRGNVSVVTAPVAWHVISADLLWRRWFYVGFKTQWHQWRLFRISDRAAGFEQFMPLLRVMAKLFPAGVELILPSQFLAQFAQPRCLHLVDIIREAPVEIKLHGHDHNNNDREGCCKKRGKKFKGKF